MTRLELESVSTLSGGSLDRASALMSSQLGQNPNMVSKLPFFIRIKTIFFPPLWNPRTVTQIKEEKKIQKQIL